MVKTLLVVVRLVGGDQDGLVGRVALELLPAEALLVGGVEVEADDLVLKQRQQQDQDKPRKEG